MKPLNLILRSEASRAYAVPAETYVRENLLPEERDPHHVADMAIAKNIYAVLALHYKGHPWAVAVSSKDGIAKIMLPAFTAWSANVRLSDLFHDPSMKHVVRQAGALLERFRLPRAGFDVSHYVHAMKTYAPIGPRKGPLPE